MGSSLVLAVCYHSYMEESNTSTKQAKIPLRKIIVITSVAALGLILVSLCIVVSKYRQIEMEKLSLSSQLSSVTEENSRLKAQSALSIENKSEVYSEKMPNGKTISYPLTKENAS